MSVCLDTHPCIYLSKCINAGMFKFNFQQFSRYIGYLFSPEKLWKV